MIPDVSCLTSIFWICLNLLGTHLSKVLTARRGVQKVCVGCLQALKDVQSGTRTLYVICAEGKANKNITIANLVRARPLTQCLPIAALLLL